MERIAYERYQLHWMLKHGYSLKDINDIAMDWWNLKFADPNYEETITDYLDEHGFHGAIYACQQEFLLTEYKDRALMKSLLSEDEYESYLQHVWIEDRCPYIEAFELLHKAAEYGCLFIYNGMIAICRTQGWNVKPVDAIAKELMWDIKGRQIIRDKIQDAKVNKRFRYPIRIKAEACRGVEYLKLPLNEDIKYIDGRIDFDEYDQAWQPWPSAEIFLGFYPGNTEQQALDAAACEIEIPVELLKIIK